MTKTIEQATVAENDALAAEHDVADYPAEGLKAEKYEAVANALGEGFEFDADELEPEATLALQLSDPDLNAAQFAIGDEQVELEKGATLEVEERHGRRLAAAHWFLEVVGEEAEVPEVLELEPDPSSPVDQPEEEG